MAAGVKEALVGLLVAAALYGAATVGYKAGTAAGAQMKAQAAEEKDRAIAEAQAEFDRRIVAQQQVVKDADAKTAQAVGDAVSARAAADGLQRTVADLVSRARADSAVGGTGSTASDPLDLLADVLGRIDERAGALAEYADAARIAGQACERSYDALTGPVTPLKAPG